MKELVFFMVEHWMEFIAEAAIICFELMGVLVIVLAGIKGIWGFFKKDPHLRLDLAKGLALGLEFTLVSEILHTIVARGFEEIATVAAIVVLRVTLTILIHWEIKGEKAEEAEEEKKSETHAKTAAES